MSTPNSKPPPLPPRPSPPAASRLGPNPPAPPLPPRRAYESFESFRGAHEKGPIPHWQQPQSRTWYPITKAGRRLFWSFLAIGACVALAVVTTICAVVIPRQSRKSGPQSDFGPGHPLSPEEGGVIVGQQGDIAKFGNRSRDFFLLKNTRSSFVTRLDPIVNPGTVSGHLHRVHGSSYFTQDLIKASEMQTIANCSTTPVQKDLSLYWVPTVHYMYPNGSLVNIPVRYTSIYYFQKAPTGEPIHPFPDNYNIVVGNPARRSHNASNYAEQALFWYCFRGGGNDLKTWEFPPTQCRDGLTSVIIFPSCWDGQEAETYAKHTAYPTDGIHGHRCPAEFPKKLPTIQFETAFDANLFPFTPGRTNWVLANGDTTGFGIHGDFMNGWDAATFRSVLDLCRYMNATEEYSFATDPHNCPALNASYNMEAALSCRSQSPIVNEPVGNQISLPNLPGCNAIWSDDGPKPACPPGRTEGGRLELAEPSVWYNNEGYVA